VRRTYIIDVCMTCGAHAVFPFICGHRREDQRWTVPIVVEATVAAQTVLDAITSAAVAQEHDDDRHDRRPADDEEQQPSAHR